MLYNELESRRDGILDSIFRQDINFSFSRMFAFIQKCRPDGTQGNLKGANASYLKYRPAGTYRRNVNLPSEIAQV